jgi:hypothetical protein
LTFFKGREYRSCPATPMISSLSAETGVTGDPPGCLGGGDNLGKQKAAFLP